MFTISLPYPQGELDKFVVQVVHDAPEGLRLCEVVVAALRAGFITHDRGEMTAKVYRILKRLIKTGRVHYTDSGVIVA